MHRRRNPRFDLVPSALMPGAIVRVVAPAVVLMAVAMMTATGCSSDTSASPPETTPSSVDTTADTSLAIDLNVVTTTTIGRVQLYQRTTPSGDIVVDADGMTLYARVPGPVDTCTGACLDAWPPLRATGASVGAGLDPTLALVGPTDDAGSTPLEEGFVTYNGHPLFHFIGDVVPGDTTGQGFNGTYFVILTDGTIVRPTAPTTTTANS